MLQDPAVLSKLSDTKATGEVKALEQFYATLQVEPAKAFYGKKHVTRAAEAQAVETLLISDNLFRLDFNSIRFVEKRTQRSSSGTLLDGAIFILQVDFDRKARKSHSDDSSLTCIASREEDHSAHRTEISFVDVLPIPIKVGDLNIFSQNLINIEGEAPLRKRSND